MKKPFRIGGSRRVFQSCRDVKTRRRLFSARVKARQTCVLRVSAMENGHGGDSTEGVLVPVSEASDAFQTSVLDPLKSAYLYEESKQCFSYKSAVLINNPLLEEKYNAFRANRREAGYSEEDLKESYGFLLFDNVADAHALGETGVLTGNSTCSALGDPANGVYISMYSDCLDPNRWYHEKSGYIAIIRLTKGRVRNVVENYTQRFTGPSEGFDCHVSEELHSVSASSFVAFERTQCYMYELLGNGKHIAHSPSAACPFAIVSFSYKNVKRCPTLVAEQKKSEETKLGFPAPVCNYTLWCGQLHIGSHVFDVGLRSAARASIPAQLPQVVKVNRGISMSDLRQLLPGAVFETCFSSEVSQGGLYYSLYEFVSSQQGISLAPLLTQIKEKNIALTFPLNDGGFLILLHSSHFLRHDGNGSSADEILLGLFVFQDSRLRHRVTTDTDSGQSKPALLSELLHAIPALNYAEGKVRKNPSGTNEELSEAFVQHMQSYTALINPKFATSPPRDLSVDPDQYDVPAADTHLSSCPDWTGAAWQNFKSYLSKPDSFQLPVTKVSVVLAARPEELIQDLSDDDCFFVASPDEVPDSVRSEEWLTGKETTVKTETPADKCEALMNLVDVPEKPALGNMQPSDLTKDIEGLVKSDDRGTKTPSSSDDLPAEMIVSITSAKRTASDADKGVFGFSAAKLEMEGVNPLSDETATAKHVFECPELTSLIQTKRRGPHGPQSKSPRCVREAPPETKDIKAENDGFTSATVDQVELQLYNPSSVNWRRGQRQKDRFATSPSKNRKIRCATASPALEEEKKSDPMLQRLDSNFLMELEALPLKRKTERGDLKPVISDCGRILVPHGSGEIADQIKNLKDRLQAMKEEPCDDKSQVDAKPDDTVDREQETSGEMEAEESEAGVSVVGADHSHPVDRIWRQIGGYDLSSLNPECPEDLTLKDSTHTSPLKTKQEMHMAQYASEIRAAKAKCLLNKLKSVLQGKRKAADFPHKEDPEDVGRAPEPRLKKHKDNCTVVTSSDAMNANLDASEAPRARSVDPVFAHALGLTPKETTDKTCKSESEDAKIKSEDPSETQAQNTLNRNSIKQSLPPISPRRGRIKMLRKHQGMSEEHVKKNWWLHFQTPSCYSSEQVNYAGSASDNSVAKTAQENSESTCSSTDALNLLADLALGASKDQVPPQPDAAVDTVPETSVKSCDLTKAPTSESVLHTLLRQPSARPSQPLESPPPCHLVGGSELVGLVYKEHDYSLPPSSSPLLDLSGALARVSPLYGSTGLLQHHYTVSGSGTQRPHAYVSNEDRSEHSSKTAEGRKNRQGLSRKFKKYRTITPKGESVQVTMECKRKYNFNRDGRLHTEPKAKAIIRGLHGPWDYSNYSTYQEKKEEQLIRHIWIGLFYSRSTARFFNVDPDETDSCSEGEDELEKPSKPKCSPTQREPTFVPPWTNQSNSPDRVLDLSRKNHPESDRGCDEVIDLSQDDLSSDSAVEALTSNQQVVQKKKNVLSPEQRETSAVLTAILSAVGQHMLHRNGLQTAGVVNQVKDGKSVQGGKRTWFVLQKVVNSDQPSAPAAQGSGAIVLAKGETGKSSFRSENHPSVSGSTVVSHGSNNEKRDIKDDIKDARLMEKQGMEEEKDSNNKARDEGHSKQQDETESENGQNDVIERRQQELCPEMTSEYDGNVICNGYPVEDEESVTREEGEIVSAGKPTVRCEHETRVDKDGLERESVDDDRLSDRPVTCISPDVVKDLERPTLEDLKDDSDLPFRNDGVDVPIAEQAVSENAPDPSTLNEPIPTEPAVQKHREKAQKHVDSDLEVRSMHIATPEHPCSEKEDAYPPEEEDVDSDLEVRSLHIVTPEHSRSEEDVNSDFETRNMHIDSPERACSERKVSFPPSGMEPDYSESSEVETYGHYMSLSDEEDNQKVALDLSMAQIKVPVENKVTAGDDLSSREDQCEAEVKPTQETDLKCNKANKELENIHSQVECQLIGINTSGEDVKWPDLHSQDTVEEVQRHQETYTYTEAPLPAPTSAASQMYRSQLDQATSRISPVHMSEVQMYSNQVELTTSQTSPLHTSEDVMYSNQVELTTSRTSPLHASGSDQEGASASDFDDRCPTPTLDEEPCQYTTNAEPLMVVTDVWSSDDVKENVGQSHAGRSSSLEKDLMPPDQKPNSAIKKSSQRYGPQPDLEERTQRVLLSVESLLPEFSPVEKADKKRTRERPSLGISRSERVEIPKDGQKQVKASSKPASREREEDRKKRATYEKHSSSGLDYYKRKASDRPSKVKYPHRDPSYHYSGREERRDKRTSHSTRRPHEHGSQSAKSSSRRADKSPHRSPHRDPHKSSPHKSSVEKVGRARKEHPDVAVMDDSLSLGADSSMTCTIFNTNRTSQCLLEHLSQRCLQDDPTQATLEQDWLIFADRMKQMVRKRKREPVRPVETKEKHRASSRSSPVSLDFSSLEEPLEDSGDHWPELPLFKRKIKVDTSDRDTRGRSYLETEGCAQPAARKSIILPERRPPVTLRRRAGQSRKYDFCDQVMKEMSKRFQSHLTSVVKSCQSKYKFYIHVTSDDPLFQETKARLEAEGHTAVQPSDFLPCEEQCSSLLVILRNTDIAEHVREVPHLLELKKSPDVQFAGIDEAEDVMTQTHQELFLSGGFAVLDRAALDSLSLCNMKKLSEVLKELNQKEKWKWMLHYRDFRWLKENARFNAEIEEKKLFLNGCQQEGILEVLPYHECDQVSGARPDYLGCLVRLQVQNISARHAVFITDTEAPSAFGANGILTTTCSSFLESFSG